MGALADTTAGQLEAQDAYLAFLVERRAHIVERVEEACARAGRSVDEIELMAVSKTVGVDEVELAWQAGWRLFGENRPQELTRKLAGIEGRPGVCDATFDMIGNLQTNKINQVVGRVRYVHSVASAHLANAIAKRSCARDVTTRALLEVNVSGEASKSGMSPEEVRSCIDEVVALPGLSVVGLMTMAPAHDPDAARRTFSGLRELAERLRADTGLPLSVLSCGMSDDFVIAVEEGSTLVRLGRTVFDQEYVLQ